MLYGFSILTFQIDQTSSKVREIAPSSYVARPESGKIGFPDSLGARINQQAVKLS